MPIQNNALPVLRLHHAPPCLCLTLPILSTAQPQRCLANARLPFTTATPSLHFAMPLPNEPCNALAYPRLCCAMPMLCHAMPTLRAAVPCLRRDIAIQFLGSKFPWHTPAMPTPRRPFPLPSRSSARQPLAMPLQRSASPSQGCSETPLSQSIAFSIHCAGRFGPRPPPVASTTVRILF